MDYNQISGLMGLPQLRNHNAQILRVGDDVTTNFDNDGGAVYGQSGGASNPSVSG